MKESNAHDDGWHRGRPRRGRPLGHWRRRLISIPLYWLAFVLVAGGLPLWLVLATLVDVWARGSLACRRTMTFFAAFLCCEVAGMLASVALWLAYLVRGGRDDDRWARRNFRLQRWWARTLFASVRRIFAMRVIVDGDAAATPGPIFVMLRHASAGDTLLPAVLISDRHGILLRYVMKRELLWDPCLDVVGNRLPNYFVRRSGGEGEHEIAAIQRLAHGLGEHDGVLICPEGTRFTPHKRERVLARLREAGSEWHALATQLHHVLPPRLGGTLGLLDADPSIDVVFCAHVGFEGTATAGQVLRGALVRRTIRVKMWRVAAAEIPRDRTGRIRWLYEHWQRMDAWVGQQATGDRPAPVELHAARDA